MGDGGGPKKVRVKKASSREKAVKWLRAREQRQTNTQAKDVDQRFIEWLARHNQPIQETMDTIYICSHVIICLQPRILSTCFSDNMLKTVEQNGYKDTRIGAPLMRGRWNGPCSRAVAQSCSADKEPREIAVPYAQQKQNDNNARTQSKNKRANCTLCVGAHAHCVYNAHIETKPAIITIELCFFFVHNGRVHI